MSQTIAGALRTGATFDALLRGFASLSEAGKPLHFQLEARCVPYLAHTVAGWVDGPPSSDVAFVLSGADPAGRAWLRFTISKIGPWRYELGCSPTPFNNANDPLSPGVPPSASRHQ